MPDQRIPAGDFHYSSKNDETIGDPISGSTGNPTNQYGLYIDITGNTNAIVMQHVHMRYPYYGFNLNSVSDLTLSHSQIGGHYAAVVNTGNACLRNVLIHDGEYVVGNNGSTRCEHATFHRVKYFRSSTYTNASLTNCLVIAVTNNVLFSGVNNETNISDTGIFQTLAQGARYLANNSSYRNAGTTNINAGLLADLRQRSTYPPLLISNSITVDTTLTPQAQRDIDLPDLGYHYLPIDWMISGLSVTGATLRVSGGATIGINAANTNAGICVESGGTLLSEGTPVNLNRFVRTHNVQEVPAGFGTNTAPLFADKYPPPTAPATLNLRFTDVPQVHKDFAFNQEYNRGTLNTIILTDSQFRGGTNYISQNVTNQFTAATNLLVENAGWTFDPYTPPTIRFRNITFKGGALRLHTPTSTDLSVKDCVFDYTTFTQTGAGAGAVVTDYNGYLTNATRLTPNGANDVVLAATNIDFQTGALGSYYLPTNSAFINAGSVTNAGFVGLWHYTTLTNQTKDAGTRLDLGFHSVAAMNERTIFLIIILILILIFFSIQPFERKDAETQRRKRKISSLRLCVFAPLR